jgi:transcriptional regulator with XRE-family HTH domain
MTDVEDDMNDVEKPSGGAETPALVMFAAELRSWRHQLGWAQTELGARVGYSDKLVSCIEKCTRTPTLEFARACDREMNLPGTFERRHEDISRESFPPWFALVPSLEEKAVKINNWDMSRIPGLVQTEDYARAVISSGRPEDSADKIERDVAARMRRQEILDRENPPLAWFVMGEAALRQVFGSPEIMRVQLDKLIESAARPGMVIQVVPFTAPDCAGPDGPMTIFDMPDGYQAVYVEGCEMGKIIEAPGEVASLVTRFDLLRAAALSRGESVRLIRKIRSEYGE